jgi:ankyrin repeat protein
MSIKHSTKKEKKVSSGKKQSKKGKKQSKKLEEKFPYDKDDFEAEFDVDFEDVKNKGYKKWVKKYPSKVNFFFQLFINYGMNEKITNDDIKYFIKYGLDINKLNFFSTDMTGKKVTVLHCACEFRKYNLIHLLLKNGADVNKKSENVSPLESVLLGHRYIDKYDWDTTEKCVKLLEKYGCKQEINSKILINKCCDDYVKKSDYLKNFIMNVIENEENKERYKLVENELKNNLPHYDLEKEIAKYLYK